MTRARNLSKLSNPSAFTVDTDNNVGVNTTSPVEKLNVVGVVSATSFFGDGSGLTGVASTDNIITGTAATFNSVVKVGTGITLDATSGIVTATGVNVTGVATASKFDGNATRSHLRRYNCWANRHFFKHWVWCSSGYGGKCSHYKGTMSANC